MACLVQNTTTVDSNSSWSPLYGGARLDQDTLQYIHKFYCKDCRMEKQAAEQAKAAAAAGEKSPGDGSGTSEAATESQPTSPQASLEEMSIQRCMDKNKESLKRKLMMRRSVNELVDAGIYPPLKTPPAFAEQRKHLERAKTGDLLRYKIQHRPDRQLLVQQHILEDTKTDPSLHEKLRQLKRARLADDLNDKLLHRPGPLELVQGNILKTDETLFEAIKDGSLLFNKTCEGEDPHDKRTAHFTFDEDSNPSDIDSSPSQLDDSSMSDVNSPPIPQAPELPPSLQKVRPFQVSAVGGKISPISTQSFSVASGTTLTFTANGSSVSKNGSNGNKSRPKKPKPKTQPKSKVIKFHEYKGPPNVVKNQQIMPPNIANNNGETPYHIMLQQQQLFLQWKLEFQQKNLTLPLLLPAQNAQRVPGAEEQGPQPSISTVPGSVVMTTATSTAPKTATTRAPTPTLVTTHTVSSVPQAPPPPPPQPPQITQHSTSTSSSSSFSNNKPPQSLEDLKVADLRAELKKRNLPVSGSKPQLIERLKPYADAIIGLTPVSMISLSKTTSCVTTTTSVKDNPVTSLSGIQTFSAMIMQPQSPVVSQEETMTTNSPPTSPKIFESAITPLSPEVMDIASPPNITIGTHIKNQINAQISASQISASQSTMTPMTIDHSRPPSVAPAEVSMDVDQMTNDLSLSLNQSLNQSLGAIKFIQSSQQQTAAALQQQVQLQTTVIQQQQQQQQLQQQQPGQVTQDDLLRQQQQRIEELQRQLEESQLRLKLQQLQHQQLQQQQQIQQQQQQLHQQQQQLQQAQQAQQQQQQAQPQVQQIAQQPAPPQLIQQPNSPPQMLNTIQISVSSDGKVAHVPQTIPVTTTKQIQIPAHLLQTAQSVPPNNQGIPAVIVQTTDTTKPTRPVLTDFFKTQTLHESLNLGKPSVSSSSAPVSVQPFIITTSQSKSSSSAPMMVNGVTNSRPVSLPTSPVEGQRLISRTPSNPFFSMPMKEPPKYDEAVKNRQQVVMSSDSTTSTSGRPLKGHTMDDVLEILIRNGELPPSAAQEPPPTPKTTAKTSTATTFSKSQTTVVPIESFLASCSALQFPQLSTFITTTAGTTVPTTSLGLESVMTTAPQPSQGLFIKREALTPPPSLLISLPVSECPNSDFLDLNDVLNQELSNMDWTSDPSFSTLDLNEASDMQGDANIKQEHSMSEEISLLNVPTSMAGFQKLNGHGSEPDLAALGLNDPDPSMQMDVSDWLDVIMPSTGLTPLSANAPVSFPSDPILTPKTQQEVLDLFNFDESDFNTPTDAHTGINWDKITEAATSSS